jgi:hypothetical protein
MVVQAYNPSYLGELKFEVSWEKKLVRLQSQPIGKKKNQKAGVVVNAYYPSYKESVNRRIVVQIDPSIKT